MDGQGVKAHRAWRGRTGEGKSSKIWSKSTLWLDWTSLHGATSPCLLSRTGLASPPGFFPLSLLVGTPHPTVSKPTQEGWVVTAWWRYFPGSRFLARRNVFKLPGGSLLTAAPVLLCHPCSMMDCCQEEAHQCGRSCLQACMSSSSPCCGAKHSLSHMGLHPSLWSEPKPTDVTWEGHSSACCRDGQETWMWSSTDRVPKEAAAWRRRRRRTTGSGHHCLLRATWAAVQDCPTGQNHGGSKGF